MPLISDQLKKRNKQLNRKHMSAATRKPVHTTDNTNKKTCFRNQVVHKSKNLPTKISVDEKQGTCSIIEVYMKPHEHTQKDYQSVDLNDAEIYRECINLPRDAKCNFCQNFETDMKTFNNDHNKKIQNDLRRLAVLLKDYMIAKNYSIDKVPELEKLHSPRRFISNKEKSEISKIFESIFMFKSGNGYEVKEIGKEVAAVGKDVKSNKIQGRIHSMQKIHENFPNSSHQVAEVRNETSRDFKVIMPPQTTETDEVRNPTIQRNLDAKENIPLQHKSKPPYSEHVNIPLLQKGNSKTRGLSGNVIPAQPASVTLDHKCFSMPNSSMKKDSSPSKGKKLSTKNAYIEASRYGSEKSALLLKKLCNSKYIPEILKYRLYLAKLPVHVALSNIYPYTQNEMSSKSKRDRKVIDIKGLVNSLTNVKASQSLQNKLTPNKMKKVPMKGASSALIPLFPYPVHPSVTDIVIGDVNEDELSHFFGKEMRNKFEKYRSRELMGLLSDIKSHRSYSLYYLLETQNVSTNIHTEESVKCISPSVANLRNLSLQEVSLKRKVKPKIKLEVHIPRVPIYSDELADEHRKNSECGSKTEIKENDSDLEFIVAESKAKTDITKMKLSNFKNTKRPKQTVKVRNCPANLKPHIVPKINKRKVLTNKEPLSIDKQPSHKSPRCVEIRDENTWKKEFNKRLRCISSQVSLSQNNTLPEIVNQVVLVIKSHWGNNYLPTVK